VTKERVVTCGACGSTARIAPGDWNDVQSKAIDAWKEAHERSDHDGETVAYSVAPTFLED
jgi:hypothetical protein